MKKKELVGAVASALCVILYYGVAAVMFARVPDIDPLAKMLLILVPIGICGVVILVLVQRLRELKSDECDDLDKY